MTQLSQSTANTQPQATRQQQVEAQSEQIINIAKNEPHSALKCIHLLQVAGVATVATYKAIQARIISDQDTYGAYHLALLAQGTPDLPVDAKALIEMVIEFGDAQQLLSLLKNLPVPPVDIIKARILASGDDAIIQQMTAYLAKHPEGLGTHTLLNNGQNERIVPLSESAIS